MIRFLLEQAIAVAKQASRINSMQGLVILVIQRPGRRTFSSAIGAMFCIGAKTHGANRISGDRPGPAPGPLYDNSLARLRLRTD